MRIEALPQDDELEEDPEQSEEELGEPELGDEEPDETADEETEEEDSEAEDLAGFRSAEEVPAELRATFRNLHKDYTQKSQQVAKMRRWETDLREAGYDPDQVLQVVKGLSGGGGTGFPVLGQAPQQQAPDPVAGDALIQQWTKLLEDDQLYADTRIAIEGNIANRTLLLQQKAENDRRHQEGVRQSQAAQVRAELTEISSNPVFAPYLKTDAQKSTLINYAVNNGYRNLTDAAKVLYFEEVRQGRAVTKEKKTAAAPTSTLRNGKSPSKAPAPKPPRGMSLYQLTQWQSANDPNYMRRGRR